MDKSMVYEDKTFMKGPYSKLYVGKARCQES